MKILKEALPHLLAIAFGAMLVIIFFSPLFFENKIIDQNDIFQGVGAGEEAKQYRESRGEEALWTNSMFSGMPTYLINISYSGELIKYVHRLISLGMPSTAQVIFLAYLCFYVLLISFRVHPLLAVAGAVAYSFNTFNLVSVEAGHIWKVRAIAYMPLVVAGVKMIFSHKNSWLSIGTLSLAVALELYANHLQITYYLFLCLLIFGVIELIKTVKEKSWNVFGKNVAALLLAVILGVGANAARLWTTMEYSSFSTRGKSELTSATTGTYQQSGLERNYVFNWSYGVKESLTLLMPNFSGGASVMALDLGSNLGEALSGKGMGPAQIREQIARVPTYWGDQPSVAGPSYVGAIILFFVVLAWFYVEKPTRNWLLIAAGIGLVLSWGKNFEAFNFLLYDYFPAYNKFRSVSMVMVMLLLSLPLLGILGLDRFLKDENENKQRTLLISGGVVAGLCAFVAFFSGVLFDFSGAIDNRLTQLPDWYLAAIKLDRKAMLTSDGFRSILFVALALGVTWLLIKGKINHLVFGSVLVLFMASDFIMVGKRFFDDAKYIRGSKKHSISASAADLEIKRIADDTHYRVLNLQDPFNEAYTSNFHSSIGGYHGAKMKRYNELISYGITPQLSAMIGALQNGQSGLDSYYIINMLNAQFLKYGPSKENIIANPSALGNAWFVNLVKKASNADEEIRILTELTSKNEVVINESMFGNLKSDYEGTGTIELLEYDPKKMIYKSESDAGGLAVFSEIYYPAGWTATIDGVETEILQANYVLRAIEVPAGQHEIIFTFDPISYRIGNLITLIMSVLMLGTFGFGIYRSLSESA
ncbi:MAG: YfhO family protein [Cyclobacteriaceae bacterium]